MKLKSFIYASVLVMSVGVAGCQNSGKKGEVVLKSKNDSISYSLGVLMGEGNKQNMKGAPGFDQLNKEIVLAAFEKAFLGDSVQIKAEVCNASVQKFFAEIAKVESGKNQKAGEEFLAANSKKAGVVTLPSGLQYEVIKTGTGPKPNAEDQVKCHYHGTTIDGKVFDSSVNRGEPVDFPVKGVIPGWTEALQLMTVGSKWKLYIPASLGYGEQSPSAEIKPNSTLIFEVELLEIVKK